MKRDEERERERERERRGERGREGGRRRRERGREEGGRDEERERRRRREEEGCLTCVGVSQHPAILQPRERPQQGQLEPFWEPRAKTLNVDLRGRQALRLEEDLVPVLILEAHNLILNRGTVPFRGKESIGRGKESLSQSVECALSVE